MVSSARDRLLRRGLLLAGASVGWNVLEGIIAVAAGTEADSVALIGFGVDSFIETSSAVVVGWRLASELRGRSGRGAQRMEQRASRAAGALLLILALYIVIDGGRRLLGFGTQAGASPLGIVLTAVSLGIMPLLGWAKLRNAAALGSRALRADAYETITCAWLSLTTLIGLALNALFGLWWTDPVAALCLVPLIVREGLEAWHGECCEGTASEAS